MFASILFIRCVNSCNCSRYDLDVIETEAHWFVFLSSVFLLAPTGHGRLYRWRSAGGSSWLHSKHSQIGSGNRKSKIWLMLQQLLPTHCLAIRLHLNTQLLLLASVFHSRAHLSEDNLIKTNLWKLTFDFT